MEANISGLENDVEYWKEQWRISALNDDNKFKVISQFEVDLKRKTNLIAKLEAENRDLMCAAEKAELEMVDLRDKIDDIEIYTNHTALVTENADLKSANATLMAANTALVTTNDTVMAANAVHNAANATRMAESAALNATNTYLEAEKGQLVQIKQEEVPDQPMQPMLIDMDQHFDFGRQPDIIIEQAMFEWFNANFVATGDDNDYVQIKNVRYYLGKSPEGKRLLHSAILMSDLKYLFRLCIETVGFRVHESKQMNNTKQVLSHIAFGLKFGGDA